MWCPVAGREGGAGVLPQKRCNWTGKFEHFFGVPPLHQLFTLFLSFFLHAFLLASALQFFGDTVGGLVTSARPLRISEMSPTTPRVADGASGGDRDVAMETKPSRSTCGQGQQRGGGGGVLVYGLRIL